MGYRYLARKWSELLPVETPCITIHGGSMELHVKRLKQVKNIIYSRVLPMRSVDGKRVSRPGSLLELISFTNQAGDGSTVRKTGKDDDFF